MTYPRILIIGETFRLNGGGGITLINLFKNWPSDKLAVATERIYETSSKYNSYKYYQLGDLETKIAFPLSLLRKNVKSGEVGVKPVNSIQTVNTNERSAALKSFTRLLLNKFLISLGLYHFIYRTVLSDKLLNWIFAYSPDIIYGLPFRYTDMKFISELQQRTSIPLAVHIMDDSISFLNKPNLLYFYWRYKSRKIFRQLINNSSVLISVSQYMSDEYYKRYHKEFIPVRNPIELRVWLPYVKNNWEVSHEIHIIYTGRLAVPNINSLYLFCQVIDNLNNNGYKIKFDIYSIDDNKKFKSKVKYFSGINVNNPVPYEDIPRLIPKYDIVFLPIDFNKKGIRYSKYSISTKTSEYMISGVPILLLAPREVALTSYANENECMLVVNDNHAKIISEALIRLIKDKSLRESLAKKSLDVVRKDSDADHVRQKFQFLLSSNYKN